MKRFSLILAALLVTGFTMAQSQWTIDQYHSKIGFSVSHLVISEVDGHFKEFDGSISSTSDDFNGAKVIFNAKVASIDTGNEKRDGHLKSDDFFGAESNPTISFDGILKKKGSGYILAGKFTMKGVTKDVTFKVKYNGTVKDPYGNIKAGFKITGEVNRQEYGLKWSALTEAGGAVVGDAVSILANIELQKKG